MSKLFLASASPRRRELLTQVGLAHQAVHSAYEEDNEVQTTPAEMVKVQALGKARGALGNVPPQAEGIILGADTIVVLDGEVLGKPKDEGEAVAMLHRLSGRHHEVITGVALLKGEVADVFAVTTKVVFRPLTEAEIRDYVATKEPLDKAGAYGIQGRGALWVEGIEGSYTNVVGLPVEQVYVHLQALEERGR